MLDLVTEKADWGKPLGPNRGRGISCFFSKTTYLAQVAEVTVKDGNIRVDRVITVVDPGRVINMNGIRAQIEGAILMGLSATLKERITVKNGMIREQNFNSYDLLRMPAAPQLETYRSVTHIPSLIYGALLWLWWAGIASVMWKLSQRAPAVASSPTAMASD